MPRTNTTTMTVRLSGPLSECRTMKRCKFSLG